jgi:DNA-binding GntR family transcriptional regulator
MGGSPAERHFRPSRGPRDQGKPHRDFAARARRKSHIVKATGMASSDDLSAIEPFEAERTVEQRLARELETLIIEGRLEQGVRLRYRDLAERFHVSVTPVRLALKELEAGRLVESIPHSGARVTSLSTEELEEIYAARVGLEGLLARRGVEKLTDETLSIMHSRFHAVRRARADLDRRAYLNNIWFYRLPCYQSAERSQLLTIVTSLFKRSRRYNWLTLDRIDRWEELEAFQHDFATECENRNGVAAEAVIRNIMDWCIEYLVPRVRDEADGL